MQDAGATRNRRTENGPSGTPAPTGCATGDMARYVWAGCAHWGVQTRDAGAGGVFRRTVIDRCGPSGRRIQNYVGCKALPLYGAREESFRAVRRSGSGDRSAGDSVRNLFAPQLQLDEREIQKPSVFGGVLFHISFAVERNMATGGKCRTRVQPAIGERKTGRRGRRPLRGARPETWRDTCGRGVPIGGVQTRDAGAGGVFRQAVIEWRRKPQNQHRRALR